MSLNCDSDMYLALIGLDANHLILFNYYLPSNFSNADLAANVLLFLNFIKILASLSLSLIFSISPNLAHSSYTSSSTS